MKYSMLLLFFFSGLVFSAENKTTVCTHGGDQRTIEVIYTGAGDVPCEVRYTKNSSTQVLWNAQAEVGYCEVKAEEFIEKQRGWGWTCLAVVDSAPVTE